MSDFSSQRPLTRRLPVWSLAFSLGLFPACAQPGQAPAVKSSPPEPASFGDGLVPVGPLKLHLHCKGRGTPVVVFDSGSGDSGTVWHGLQEDLAKVTQNCAYDRAGLGYSDWGQKPRTSSQMADELHALLQAARLPPPYVLVGHSAGGMNVRLFASQHAPDVAGMVLVDSVSSTHHERYLSQLPAATLDMIKGRMRMIPDGWDFDSFVESQRQMAAAPALGDIPLLVLSRGEAGPPEPGVTPELGARLFAAWSEMQAELPELSTNSVRIVVPKSGHYIQWQATALVVEGIAEVVRAARTHSELDGTKLTALATAPKG